MEKMLAPLRTRDLARVRALASKLVIAVTLLLALGPATDTIAFAQTSSAEDPTTERVDPAQHALSATQVIFVSDRADPLGELQSEIYVYDDGSEIRLTRSTNWGEYDPAPAPSGDEIAAAATDFDFRTSSFEDAWSWRYFVYDLDGRELQAWPVAGSEGMFRPAGGFQIAWLPNDRGFLANAFETTGEANGEATGDATGQTEPSGGTTIVHYIRGADQTVDLGGGYEIALHPDGDRFATSDNGIIYLVEIASGARTTFAGGRPLGWSADGSELLFEQGTALYRAPETRPDRLRLVIDAGPYVSLRHAPGGERYAVATVGQGASEIYFFDADHRSIEGWTLGSAVTSFDWLDETWLVVEVVDALGRKMELLSVDGAFAPFVDSFADDGSPRVLRGSSATE